MKKSASRTTKAKKESAQKPEEDNFLIVGIGASAGGVQALKKFFANVAADSNAAYVVILHLSPDHESRLAEILQTVAKIPVKQVSEKIEVNPNHIYVVSPNESLSMRDGHIDVSPIHTVEERRAPVDIFFRTLAESHHARAVAVVLSGTGANGSMGIKRIKENGGAAFVQNPREAEFGEMPRNSIATELIDEVLNVEEIPAKIIDYQKNLGKIVIPVEPESRPAEQQQAVREIFTLLRVRTGHDFANYKRPTVLRRIERRINVRNLPGLPEYAAYLRENPDEAQALLKDLLISVTNFFRDKEAFRSLERDVLPEILHAKNPGEQIRLWVAGCATGEEAYSIAMLLAEKLDQLHDAPEVQIFATDIDEEAIMAARSGFYTLNDAADVSPERLRRFFNKQKNGYRVRRELREMILFANHNLLKDPPFSRLDLVTCRNLLIYFNQTAQERVLETFHFALKPGGFLFLGTSESIDGAGDIYAPFDREDRIFQSRQIASRLVYPMPDLSPSLRFDQTPPAAARENGNHTPERISYGDLHGRILEQLAPPSLVINENFDIVHVSPRAGSYLQIAGEVSSNLFKLIRPELRYAVSAAVAQAVQKQINVVTENLKISVGDDRSETISVSVRPVLRQTDGAAQGFIVIIFEPTESSSAPGADEETVLASPEPATRQLEEALLRSQTQYRFSVEQSEIQAEELKASNEELQAINEELRSATEELETGKEELQSVNEELVTVNQELKIKIEELSNTNNNLQNLINSTRIGTIFLDRNFCVKLFTPAAGEIFNFIQADSGRLLSDITHRLEYENLTADVETVLRDLQPVEREVRSTDGNYYLAQISPYRTSEDRIGGTILTFVNITKNKRQEEKLRESEERLKILIRDLPGGAVFIIDQNFRYLLAEGEALAAAGLKSEDLVGKTVFEIVPPEDAANYRKMYEKALAGESFKYEHHSHGKTYVTHGTPLRLANGKVNAAHAVSYDISDRIKAEESLRESEERLRLIVNSVKDYAILTTDAGGIINGWNAGAEKIFGYTKDEIIGQPSEIIFTEQERAAKIPEREMQTALAEGVAEDERWQVRKDGSQFFAAGVLEPIKDGKIDGFVKILRDMTERLKAEQIEQDKKMLQKLVTAQEDERRRIARDLHDELGQLLTALRLQLEAVRKLCDQSELCGKVDEAQLTAKQLDTGIDFLAWELRPAALDDFGLYPALAKYAREWSHYSGITADLLDSTLKKARFSPEVETNLYRIAQEALNNVYKHADARRAEISFDRRGDLIVLIIEDDGIGFDPPEKFNRKKGIGLIGMRERAALIGGSLEIESAPDKGTTVFVRVPISMTEKEISSDE